MFILLSALLYANNDCVLNSIEFQNLSENQTSVLKSYGAKCQPAKNSSAQNKAVDATAEKEASALYRKVQTAIKNGDIKTAKALIAQMEKEYGDTRIWKRAKHIQPEVNLVGKKAPETYDIDWYQGTLEPNQGTTLIVFWEVWCPHCRHAIPKLESKFQDYKDQGLQVVGLTRLSRNKTKEDAMSFITENNVTYPIGQEDGSIGKHFAVSGIPAAAIIKNGTIIWRGHPTSLQNEDIEKYLNMK